MRISKINICNLCAAKFQEDDLQGCCAHYFSEHLQKEFFKHFTQVPIILEE